VIDPALGQAFQDEDVARCYGFRAPYAPGLYARLLDVTSGRRRMLDLGCGTGKIARSLASRFGQVDAVDPSGPLLRAGQSAAAQTAPNITWIQARAEHVELSGPYDLITAGASLHWMSHDLVFPKLARILAPAGVVAAVSGDGGSAADWDGTWKAFLGRWLERVGRRYDEAGFAAAMNAYQDWMEVAGRESFTYEHQQPIEAFIAAQHSRETWARARMGLAQADAFDAELKALLEPHAPDGLLQFPVTSTLIWGRPRAKPKS
jgi:ubiquinone/menaquinone biosynthesis C-methylase UbiE